MISKFFGVLNFHMLFPKLNQLCRVTLHAECPKHHGHKGDTGVTPGTCGAIGERAQVILVWLRAPGFENASHPQRLEVTRVRPKTMCSLWHANSRKL